MRNKNEISVIHFVYIFMGVVYRVYICIRKYNLSRVNRAVLLIQPLAHRAHMF